MARDKAIKELSGKDAEDLLFEKIIAHHNGLIQALAHFNAEEAFFTWLNTIRAIEELINLPLFGLDDEPLKNAITNLRLLPLDLAVLKSIVDALVKLFGESFTQRFVNIIQQSSAIGMGFHLNGHYEVSAGFQTVGHVIGYFQSRRRHLMALLYTIPTACRGKQSMERLDTLNQLLPHVEHSCITLTGLHEKVMLSKVFPDFKLLLNGNGFFANHTYEPLDNTFLEPERTGIVEILQDTVEKNVIEQIEPIDPRLIFSAAELRNNIRQIESAYAEFDLTNTAFGQMAELTRQCLIYCEDDYLINVPHSKFEQLTNSIQLTPNVLSQFIHQSDDYAANTNSYAPFINLSSSYVSTVTLLTRFLYYWKNICLNRNRRFQIRSGFIFESTVKRALSDQGFTVTDIKRINRKEFDVVAVLGQIIYNVQCKNNLVDLSKIENNADLFARYNRQLDRYYSKALIKEKGREELLKSELGLSEVRHMVVSRFPIATINSQIISYNRIDHFKSIINKVNW